ncbi:MAG: crotonase/enoyl-CoA hydratase family protein [Pseudomonadota bacterium]
MEGACLACGIIDIDTYHLVGQSPYQAVSAGHERGSPAAQHSTAQEDPMTKDALYTTAGPIATITLNRPEKYNTLRPSLLADLDDALRQANTDDEIKVIVLEGAGDAFCAGFDFSGGLEHFDEKLTEGHYDPGMDVDFVVNPYKTYMTQFMGLWRGLKPTIAKVHGYCMGGGSEMALCADLVIASHDARIGTPYSRVWGCHLSGMWVYRLGLAKAKYYALTGASLSGEEAAEIELINQSVPLEDLDQTVADLADKLAGIPLTQLISMKLIVNQAYDNMGLQSTQTLGPILDGIMRNTPEGRDFVRVARDEGVKAAVTQRDGPFGDYSQAPPEHQPRKRSELGL